MQKKIKFNKKSSSVSNKNLEFSHSLRLPIISADSPYKFFGFHKYPEKIFEQQPTVT